MKPVDKQHEYEVRFYKFLNSIIRISAMKPKDRYLYPIMDSVPFRDLEVSILMAHIEHDGTEVNDNNDKG